MQGNRSAAIRIPLCDADNPKAKRLEFRCPDAAGCPYLSFTAMVMAGIDGIRKKIDPPPPVDCDASHLTADVQGVKNTPASLKEVLDALEQDHEFLLEGGVFTKVSPFSAFFFLAHRLFLLSCCLVYVDLSFPLYALQSLSSSKCRMDLLR